MIDVTNISSNTTFDVDIVRQAVLATLNAHQSEDCEVSVLLTDDTRITKLNWEYRGIDAPTDVLAFAQLEGEDAELTRSNLLGDVVISLETAERQARDETHTFEAEVVLLTIHGVLHLLGYDHQSQNDASIMFEKQDTILQLLQAQQ